MRTLVKYRSDVKYIITPGYLGDIIIDGKTIGVLKCILIKQDMRM
jgi:hypothetical protein